MNKLDEALDKIKLGDSVGHGLVRPTIGATDYILGASPLPRVVLQPNGQWTDWLPANELQNRGRFETYACGIYNTLACIEILGHRLLDIRTDYAERPVAIAIKLAPPGSDPSKNIEAIRKEIGLVPEEMLPFDDSIQTIEQYMTGLTEQIKVEGKKFIAEYKVGWEWVYDWNVHDLAEKQKRLMEALKYSPVGIAVDAWAERNGLYYNRGQANHWTMLIGFSENKYWLVQDSYAPHMKKIAWDSVPDFAIRYHLERRPKEEQIKLLADTINSNRNWVYDLTTKLAEFFLSLFELNTLKKNDMPEPKPVEVVKPTPKYLWDNPKNVRHSIRVICDESGLSVYLKNVITACIQQESGFNPKAIGKVNKNGTIDYGLCQYNNGRNAKGVPYWIGEGAVFKDTNEVLNDPEKNVRVMIAETKRGNLKYWASFSTDAYLKYMPK